MTCEFFTFLNTILDEVSLVDLACCGLAWSERRSNVAVDTIEVFVVPTSPVFSAAVFSIFKSFYGAKGIGCLNSVHKETFYPRRAPRILSMKTVLLEIMCKKHNLMLIG